MESEKKESPAANGAGKYLQRKSTKPFYPEQDVIGDFKKTLDKAGLSTRDKIVPDGKLHRFHVEGDRPGSKNGAYVLYGDGLSAGWFGCWKRQISETWCAKADQQMTAVERAEFARRMNEARKARETEEQARQAESRNRAAAIWQAAPSAPGDHPYLVKKSVKSHGLRLHKGLLIIPLHDSNGSLHSLQFIDDDGNKRFLSGGRKKGCYFALGSPVESLCIVEGYATAASIYESTGFPVAVAFDAGNLMAVALALRAKFLEIKITLCADNDAATPGNPGLTKARQAAAAVGAYLAVPPCVGDFNDFLRGQRDE